MKRQGLETTEWGFAIAKGLVSLIIVIAAFLLYRYIFTINSASLENGANHNYNYSQVYFPEEVIEKINKEYLKNYPLEMGMCGRLVHTKEKTEMVDVKKGKISKQTSVSVRFKCTSKYPTQIHSHTFLDRLGISCNPSERDIEIYDVNELACVVCGNSTAIYKIKCWKKVEGIELI